MTIIILIISLILVAILMIIFAVALYKTSKENEILLNQVKEYTVNEKELQYKTQDLEIRLDEMEDDNKFLKNQLDAALSNNANAEEALRSRYTALTDSVAAAEQRLEQLNNQVDIRTSDLNDIAAQFKELHDKLTEASAQNIAAASELESYKLELQQIIKELDDAKQTKRGIVLNSFQNEQNWFDFNLSNKEIKLIETISEIGILYPELTKDLATIEWKKLWLPKFQDLCNTHGLAVRGIYRLVLKEDENICYVGQAVNIKERWYEHTKKMIGADNKGNEKLYNYRPEDFYWTVLETGTADLNSAEHYWIEYYCCKEVGLNKKA